MKERPAAVLQRTKFEPESLATTRIGEWRIAPDLNQIARGAEIVRLEPKAMAVLLRLAARPGEVVSRDELLAAVWPNVIVGDNALTQVVIKLRKALGDTAHEPRYIQAISKKGYRLIATVEYELQTPGQAAAEMPAQRLPPRPARADADPPPTGRGIRSTRAVWAISATLVMTAAAGTGWWLWQGQAGDVASSAIEPSSVSGDALPLVSVEPFEAVGTEPRHELIARGITADLVTDLSKVSNLRVATGVEPPSTRAALRSQARYVLSGSVQGDHGRLRLHAHLADVVAGRQLWSQRFDRDSTDLFAVQDDLVRSILAVLPVKVSEAETLRLAQRYTRNLEAYEHFLRGQSALLVRSRAQNEIARALYWEAIRTDPSFARAYAGLAMTYALDYQLGWAADGGAALTRALEFAQTAEQMSPEVAETHWVLGFVHTQRRQHDEALRHLDRALRLNPSYADAYALKGGISTYIGRPREAVGLLRTSFRLNPSAGSLYFLLLGRAYYFLGDGEQALVNLEQALLRNPQNLEAHIYLAAVHHLQARLDAAQWEAGEIRALEPAFDVQRWLASYPLTDAAQKARLLQALRLIGL